MWVRHLGKEGVVVRFCLGGGLHEFEEVGDGEWDIRVVGRRGLQLEIGKLI